MSTMKKRKNQEDVNERSKATKIHPHSTSSTNNNLAASAEDVSDEVNGNDAAPSIVAAPSSDSLASNQSSRNRIIRKPSAARRQKRLETYFEQMAILNYRYYSFAKAALDGTVDYGGRGPLGPITGDGAYFAFVENYRQEVTELKRKYLRSFGDVVVFGHGDCGQLGLGSAVDSARRPRVLTSLRGCEINMVAAGGLHNLALGEIGCVYSWGINDDGALGGVPEDEGYLPITVTGFLPSIYGPNGDGKEVEGGNGVTDEKNGEIIPFLKRKEAQIVQVEAGGSHSLALSSTGDVYMWGSYVDEEGRKFRNLPPKDDLRKQTGFKDMESLEEDDDPSNYIPPRGPQNWPMHLWQLPQRVKDISAGANTNAAVLEDGSIVTWGVDGSSGNLGRPVPKFNKNTEKQVIEQEFLMPKPVVWAGPTWKRTVLKVSCGGYHLLVVTRDARNGLAVYSCGLNQYGQLGHGDKENRYSLTKVTHFEGHQITKVEGGTHHSYFVDVTGKKLYSCGRGDYGQLGITLGQPQEGYLEWLPVRVPLVYEPRPGSVANPKENCIIEADIKEDHQPEIEQISAGESHGLVLTKSGDVYSWGFGEMGACGQGKSDEDVYRPKKLESKLTSTHSIKYLSGGGQHSVAVISTGSLMV